MRVRIRVRANVSTATSSEPRDWSRISSRCLQLIAQKARESARATRHEGGKSGLRLDEYLIRVRV